MDAKSIARKISEEAMVLLENRNQCLPLPAGKRVAVFGRTQVDTIFSGNGSGASYGNEIPCILEGCIGAGILIVEELADFYRRQYTEEKRASGEEPDFARMQEMVNCGLMYEIFGRYQAPKEEYRVEEELLQEAQRQTDTAIFVLGRNAGGEECDRHLEEDYKLTESEAILLESICTRFAHVIVLLNTNGLVDLAWTKKYPSVESILFVGIPGEEGALAVAEILTGQINPSGKMAVTVAEAYEDYPCGAHFSWDKEHPEKILTYESYGLDAEANGSRGFAKSPVTVYQEDIYLGYRYFDTFYKKPLYAFGYGLSYTTFDIKVTALEKNPDRLEVQAEVTNTGTVKGKEVVQVYLAAEHPQGERAYQELKGFAKTSLLAPGEKDILNIPIDWDAFAQYDMDKACFVIPEDCYRIFVGNASDNTQTAGEVVISQEILIEQCTNRLQMKECNRGKLAFLARDKGNDNGSRLENRDRSNERQEKENDAEKGRRISLTDCDIPAYFHQKKAAETESDEIKKQQSGKDFTVEQLASLCVGYGPGIPFAPFLDTDLPNTISDAEGKPLTTNSHPVGQNGYVSPAMKDKGILSIAYKDGPAGVGGTVWATEMLMACAFDTKLWYQFGDAVGRECEDSQIDVWLAPAVNLHRNPLGGRNFEYFSEDPFLTGICACQIAKGVQENHAVLVCPKHFAVNEQETYRRGSKKWNYDAVDSIISERAARELYLKPFEMLVKDAHVQCLMTSFNKINGIFAGGNEDLCRHILREEWGFTGIVVTDWGDMDIVVDGADAVNAGNDIVMPGGPPVIGQILEGYKEGRVSRRRLEEAVGHLQSVLRSF